MKRNILILLLLLINVACAPQPHSTVPTASSPYAAKPNPHPYSYPAPTSYSAPVVNNRATLLPKPYPLNPQSAMHREVKVGLLLPLSGANAKLGQNMLDAAMLGLFDKYALNASASKIMLLPKNTGDSTKGAVKATQDAIHDGAQLLLGPLDAASTKAIKPLARKAGVDIISFSNNQSVAGDGAYLMGFMQQEQISHIISHIANHGKQHVAVLLPTNTSNDMIEATLLQSIAKAGLKEFTIAKYDAGVEDFSAVVGKLRNAIASKPQPADAILLLEGGERVVQLVASLQAQGVISPYYGIGLLDNQALLGKPALLGVEFASTSARNFQQFAARFEHEYGYSPSKISSLGYDATAIAADIFADGGAGMERAQGFVAPANGAIRFDNDGVNQRNLAIIRIENGGFKEISPAKRIFE